MRFTVRARLLALAACWALVVLLLPPARGNLVAGVSAYLNRSSRTPIKPEDIILPPWRGTRGKVVDSETRLPIAGACVLGPHPAVTHCSAFTDSSGYYHIDVGCFGKNATVVIAAPGYRTVELKWPEDLIPREWGKGCCCDSLEGVSLIRM